MRTNWGGACGVCVLFACAGAARIAAGQCEAKWLAETAAQSVTGSVIAGMTLWDSDGPGPLAPKVIVAGSFSAAGGVSAKNVASWDGVNWEQIGGGTNGFVISVATLSDGRLVIAGNFSRAGTVPVSNIAIWDGVQWSALGAGLSGSQPGVGFQVDALCADTHGGVYAAGAFTTAGSTPVSNIAYWNGATWAALSSGLSGFGAGYPWVSDLLLLPNGDLLAGGAFSDAGGTPVKSIARWDGTSWSDLAGGGVEGTVWCMKRAPSGSIYVGGNFGVLTGVFQAASNIAEWNGTKWNRLGSGVAGTSGNGGSVRDASFLPNGDLVVGGMMTMAGGSPASSIARWNGSAWSTLASGLPTGVQTMLIHPNGELIVGRDASSSSNKTKMFSRWTSGENAWIAAQPQQSTTQCGGSTAFRSQVANGYDVSVARWYHGDALLSHDPAAGVRIETVGGLSTLRLDNISPDRAGAYRCIFSTECMDVESVSAELVVTGSCCMGDLNLDGQVNDADFGVFVAAYNILACDDELMAPGCASDLNSDGVVDDLDFGVFVAAYNALVCP